MIKIVPKGNDIVVKKHKTGEDKVKTNSYRATIIEVGPGRILESTGTRVYLDYKKGDTVQIKPYAGHDIELGSEVYTVVNEDDIVCVLEYTNNSSTTEVIVLDDVEEEGDFDFDGEETICMSSPGLYGGSGGYTPVRAG